MTTKCHCLRIAGPGYCSSTNPRYDVRPSEAYWDALGSVFDQTPPFDVVFGPEAPEEQHERLQDWAVNRLDDSLPWSTGIGGIEAAEMLVREAIDNANIWDHDLGACPEEKR